MSLSTLQRYATEIELILGSSLGAAREERRRLTDLGRDVFLNGGYDELAGIRSRIEDVKADLRSDLGDEISSLRVLDSEWSGPMGNLAVIDQYIKMERLGHLDDGVKVLLGDPLAAANPHLFNLWSRQMPTARASGERLRKLEHALWPISEQIDVRPVRNGVLDLYRWLEIADVEWVDRGFEPILELDEQSAERGQRILRRWGVSDGDWFVAVHVRDSGTPNREVANSEISSYIDAFKLIVDHGGWVIRMGVPNSKPLPRMKGVIDYSQAVSRSPWMDVFLWARCRFFIGSASGPLSVPNVFGRPTLVTNNPSIGLSFSFAKGFEVPKLLRRTNEDDRAMALRDSLLHPAARTASSRVLSEGVALADCTNRDLELAVRDMLALVGGEAIPNLHLSRKAAEIKRERGARGMTPLSPSFLESVLQDCPDFLRWDTEAGCGSRIQN